jgi:hypothetical protein
MNGQREVFMQPLIPASLSRTHRLRLASIGALTLHAILFASGWLALKQISIPASENRMMVLSLESTPTEGLQQQITQIEDTVTDAPQGQASAMQLDEARRQPPEVSQRSSVPHPKATFDIYPEPVLDVLPEQESVSHKTVNQPAFEQVAVERSPSEVTEDHNARLDNPAASQAVSHVDTRTELDSTLPTELYTAKQGTVSVPSSHRRRVIDENNPEISEAQQSMIERRIQQWATKLATTEQVDSSFSWQHKGQTYVAKLTHLPANSNMDLDELLVEVKTNQDGEALRTVLRMKKLAFSNFAQFVHRWDPRVMIHDDQMNGRFHSNSEILLTSDRRTRPLFRGKVTTASYRVGFENSVRRSTKREIFQGGLETGVKRIQMPKPTVLFSESIGAGKTDVINFNTNTRIVFSAEGGFNWHPEDEAGAPRYQVLPEHPLYLVAERGVTLSISGDVTGKIVVYSPTKIVINDDLRYVETDIDQSDDVIGIISGGDVVIAGQEETGDGDLTVHGSIFARRRFHVRDYSKRHTGTLNIFGSVSAGTISATQPRYATNIVFDKRFERIRPPGFPVTDRYEISSIDPSLSTDD